MSDLLSYGVVKTRKSHKCFGCLTPIPQGANAEQNVCRGDSGLYTIYLCEDCIAFEKTLPADYWIDGEYGEGELAIAKQEREKEAVRPSLDRAELFSQS